MIILQSTTPITLHVLYSVWKMTLDDKERRAAAILHKHKDFDHDLRNRVTARCMHCNGAAVLGVALDGCAVNKVSIVVPTMRCNKHRAEGSRTTVTVPQKAWTHACLYAEKMINTQNTPGKAYTPFDAKGGEEELASKFVPEDHAVVYASRFRIYKLCAFIAGCDNELVYEAGDENAMNIDRYSDFGATVLSVCVGYWRHVTAHLAAVRDFITTVATYVGDECKPIGIRIGEFAKHLGSSCARFVKDRVRCLSQCPAPWTRVLRRRAYVRVESDEDWWSAGSGDIEMQDMTHEESTSFVVYVPDAADVGGADLTSEQSFEDVDSPRVSRLGDWDPLPPPPDIGAGVGLSEDVKHRYVMEVVDDKERFHQPYAPILGSVYPAVPLLRGDHWQEIPTPLREDQKRKVAVLDQIRAAVAAGETEEEALSRYGVAAQARITAPLPKGQKIFIADAKAESNTWSAINGRHFTDSSKVILPEAELQAMRRISDMFGRKLAKKFNKRANATELMALMPSSWDYESCVSAIEQMCTLMAGGDDKKGAKLWKRFFIKHNECLSKAKARGIMSEDMVLGKGVTLMHAIVANAVEHAFEETGLKSRTIKHGTPEAVEKRLRRLLGKHPELYWAISADYGSFDATQRPGLRQAGEQTFLHGFCEELGFDDMTFNKPREGDRNKSVLRFHCGVAKIITTEFGRGSGDRFTSVGNWINNFVDHLVFLEREGLDVDLLIDRILEDTCPYDENDGTALADCMLEGDDNIILLLKEWVAMRGGPEFFERQKAHFKRLELKWEPMIDDDTIATTFEGAYRSAEDRIEFISRHYVWLKDESRLVSFPKLGKSLTTSQVTFSLLDPRKYDLIGQMAMAMRFSTAACPLLYEYYSALERTGGDKTKAQDWGVKEKSYVFRTLEEQRKDLGHSNFEQMITQERERVASSLSAVRDYVVRNYEGYDYDSYDRLVLALSTCNDWEELGHIRTEVLWRAKICKSQERDTTMTGGGGPERPADGEASPIGQITGIPRCASVDRVVDDASEEGVASDSAAPLPSNPQLLMSVGHLPMDGDTRKPHGGEQGDCSQDHTSMPSPDRTVPTGDPSTLHWCEGDPGVVNSRCEGCGSDNETLDHGQQQQINRTVVGAGKVPQLPPGLWDCDETCYTPHARSASYGPSLILTGTFPGAFPTQRCTLVHAAR